MDHSLRPDASDRPDLVFGLVGALGADLDFITDCASNELSRVDYMPATVHLSRLLHLFSKWERLEEHPLDVHIGGHQKAGNDFRRILKRNDAMAALAVLGIHRDRFFRNRSEQPISCSAYIVRSLKRPEEVALLRQVFGPRFFLIAGYSRRDERVGRLAEQIASSHGSTQTSAFRDRAQKLVAIDDFESAETYGQRVRDTFPQADVFIDLDRRSRARCQIRRLIEIIFSSPFHTPTPDEFVMFHANAAALRSSHVSRQVGAAVSRAEGDVSSVGCNDVPKAGGGMYWPGDSKDARDFRLGENPSLELRKSTLSEVLARLDEQGWIDKGRTGVDESDRQALVEKAWPLMKGTQLEGIEDFGRAVHAEMAALLDAARQGISTLGAALYTTTFPCQNCARHIVAAGVGRVVYVEPFPESLAERLHSDSIVFDNEGTIQDRVNFQAFTGIAPRRYLDLFSKIGRKDEAGQPLHQGATMPRPEFRSDIGVDFAAEKNVVDGLRVALKRASLVAPGTQLLRRRILKRRAS